MTGLERNYPSEPSDDRMVCSECGDDSCLAVLDHENTELSLCCHAPMIIPEEH